MDDHAPPPRKESLRRGLMVAASKLDDAFDAASRRIDGWTGGGVPGHIAAYRGWGDADRIEMMGRLLADSPQGGPGERDSRLRNLVNTVSRFASDEIAGTRLVIQLGSQRVEVVTDGDGYYTASIPGPHPADSLWATASASLADGSLATPQPVLQVGPDVRVGVISDIDDTILESGITDWKTAAQLTFLNNARTRKPLKGVAKLYQALQSGLDGAGRVPIFYVSSSPWNLYDLLESFMELNAIPPGPIFLRDLGVDPDKFIKSRGHGQKLERARLLIERYPKLRWVLIGDSGQADADLYSQAAEQFGNRIAAIYIRDVDPDLDSPYDTSVSGRIEHIAGTGVPMLLVKNSRAIADHAASLGLLDPKWIDDIAREVERDVQRPTLAQAATESAVEGKKPAEPPVEGGKPSESAVEGGKPTDGEPPAPVG